jgi:hypothetical protein
LDAATARDRYQFVAEAWRNADAGLQVYVAEARAAGARLGPRPEGEPRRPTPVAAPFRSELRRILLEDYLPFPVPLLDHPGAAITLYAATRWEAGR